MAIRDRRTDSESSAGAARRWHAVSVKPVAGACPAALAAHDRRWLSREAPILPLPGCTRPDACQCTYQHHDDRRAGSRRAEDLDAFARQPQISNNRRKQRTRRQGPGSQG